jgi:murein L,D-transpeptidase YcbB/YkuD
MILAALILLVGIRPVLAVNPFTVADILRSQLESLQANGQLMVHGQPIRFNRVLVALYAQSRYEARWRDASATAQLMAEIRSSWQDGLNPQDYHLDTLEDMGLARVGEIPDPLYLSQRDLLLTDALIQLAFHLYHGKVDPRRLHPRWRTPAFIGNREAAALINRRIEATAISLFIDSLRPDHPAYRRLRAAMIRYRRLAEAGGWPADRERQPRLPGAAHPSASQANRGSGGQVPNRR